MRTIVFSDSHLDESFNQQKFDFLKKIISSSDQVIINGDFWDGYSTTFNKFIESPWKKLFPLLKKKNTVYVYGNHDNKKFADKYVNLFSDKQTKQYIFKSKGKTFIVEHGDRLFPHFDVLFRRSFKRNPTPILNQMFEHVEGFLLRRFGKKALWLFYSKLNKTIKAKIKKEFTKGEYFICGHTHLADKDENRRFANCGLVEHGLGQYIVIEDGNIYLKEEWYS